MARRASVIIRSALNEALRYHSFHIFIFPKLILEEIHACPHSEKFAAAIPRS